MIFFQSLSLWIKLNGKQFICRNDVIPLTQPMNSLYNKSTLSTIQVLFLFAQNSNGILDKQEKILYKQDEIFYKLNKILHAKKAPRANKEKCETPIAVTFIFMVMLTIWIFYALVTRCYDFQNKLDKICPIRSMCRHINAILTWFLFSINVIHICKVQSIFSSGLFFSSTSKVMNKITTKISHSIGQFRVFRARKQLVFSYFGVVPHSSYFELCSLFCWLLERCMQFLCRLQPHKRRVFAVFLLDYAYEVYFCRTKHTQFFFLGGSIFGF